MAGAGAEGEFQLRIVLPAVQWPGRQVSGRRAAIVGLSVQRTPRLSGSKL